MNSGKKYTGNRTRQPNQVSGSRRPGNRRHRRTRRDQVRRQRRFIFIAAAVLCAILIVLVICGVMFGRYIKEHDNGKILNGVFIGQTDVSGMTEKEAEKAVEETLAASSQETIHFQLENGSGFDIVLEHLGFDAENAKEAVSGAVSYGKKGNVFQRYRLIRKSEKKELKKQFDLNYTVDEEKTIQQLTWQVQPLLATPINAAVTQGASGVELVEGRDGEALDSEKTLKALYTFLGKEWDGKGGNIKVALVYSEPDISENDLAEVDALLGTCTTWYGNDGSGRAKNVESGAMHLNGIFLAPGQEQSADAAMAPYTFENGYEMAASYEGDRVVDSMGGGICQVSTTLYNALLYAEVEIVERYPHSMRVGYVDASMDAAIADNLLDLVFKNNRETPIYIESILSGGEITFNVYGKEIRDPGREIRFESEVTESKPLEEKRFESCEEPIGYMESKQDGKPREAARLWKIVLQDGVEVSRDIINYSQYAGTKETIKVGVSSDNPQFTERMNNAIGTKNEEEIRRVMNEILEEQKKAQENEQQDNQ